MAEPPRPTFVQRLQAAIAAYPDADLATLSETAFVTMRDLLVATAFADGLDDRYFEVDLETSRDEIRRIAALWVGREAMSLADLERSRALLANVVSLRPVRGWTGGDLPSHQALEAAMKELEPISHDVVRRLAADL